ncbi:MAG: STAS domain-containing protein [Nitriliruptorales bacterium]|nr:STAS domain-containing protein [Nitriliruptorales bacterium]
MNATNLTLTTSQASDGMVVLEIAGDVTPAADEALSAAHAEATDAGATTLVLDFSKLEYLNSGGIGLLVTLLVRSQRAKQRLVAVGLDDHYREIFSLTRLDDAIEIHDRLEEVQP